MIQLFPDEKIVLEVRRHWFMFFLQTLYLAVFIAVPLGFWAALAYTNTFIVNPELLPIFNLIAAAWLLMVWMVFFINWTNFYLDAWLITNKRIIDIEQYALFNREVGDFRIDNIQNITINVEGVIATLLNFGDVLVETAAENKNCLIKDAPHPGKVKAVVAHLQAAIDKSQKPASI